MPDQPPRRFQGFPAGKSGTIHVPNLFFSELLPMIDNLPELKVTVHCFWAVQQREGKYRYVRWRDLAEDALFMTGLGAEPESARQVLAAALEAAVARGTLLHIRIPAGTAGSKADEDLYFINTDRGRKAIEALEHGDWAPGGHDLPVGLVTERPNIFALYEKNIGMIGAMLADVLRDAENTYPADWIEEAVQIAVEQNKRSWKYIEAILKRWMTEGKQSAPQSKTAVSPYLRDTYFKEQDE